jgi:outer membrane beta-barrel protein
MLTSLRRVVFQSTRILFAVCCFSTLLTQSVYAQGQNDRSQDAQQGFSGVKAIDREAPEGTALIDQKLHSTAGRFELDLMFARSFSDGFLSHIGGQLGLTWHISDWFGLEAFGYGYYPQELSILRAARSDGTGRGQRSSEVNPNFSNTWQNFAGGGLLGQWAPFYGKISLVSELDLSFQLYLSGGVSFDAIAKPSDGPIIAGTNYDYWIGSTSGASYDTALRISGVGGVGLRIFLLKHLALRAEVRGSVGANDLSDSYGKGQDWVVLPVYLAGLGFIF